MGDQPKEKKAKGAPPKYTPELADDFCERIATSSMGVHAICKQEGMPGARTIFQWLTDEDKKDFQHKYARAKELQAEYMAEEILDIADDGRNDLMTVTYGNDTYEKEDKEVTNR